MTTRRSRLKAVANLPVRRKLTTAQTGVDDATVPDNGTSGQPALTGKNDNSNEINKCISDKQVKSTSDASDNGGNSVSDTENNNNSTGGQSPTHIFYKSDAKKKNDVLEPQVNAVEQDTSLISNEVSQNNTIISETLSTDSSIANRTEFLASETNEKPAHSESGSCLSADNVCTVPNSLQNDNNNSETEKKSVDILISKDNSNQLNSINSYILLTPGDSSESSLSTIITPIAPCVQNESTTDQMTSIISQSDDYNGIPMYTNVVDSTDLLITLPPMSRNRAVENTDMVLDVDDTEPVLTTLVNCNESSVTAVDSVSNYKNTNNIVASHDNTQQLLVNNGNNNSSVIDMINYSDIQLVSQNLTQPVTGVLDQLETEFQRPTQVVSNTTPKRNLAAVKRKRSRCSDFTKKLADARREFQKKYENSKPDRSTLKMIDLIFYNPSTNPMQSKDKSEKKSTAGGQGGVIQEMLAEEEVDEPQALDSQGGLQEADASEVKNVRMPVPQVKIDMNGEIILDEKSIIIETSEAKKGREDLMKNSVPIFEDRGSRVSYYRGKTRKSRDWSDFETKRFYKALNTIGPDFSLMQKYFPKRSRLELKNKFKREEKLNRSLIDKALINPSEFDMTQLENDLAVETRAEEIELEMKLSKGTKEKPAGAKRARTKASLFSREMTDCNGENENSQTQPSDDSSKDPFKCEKDKKEREIGFIFKKIILNGFENQMHKEADMTVPTTPGLHYTSNDCVL